MQKARLSELIARGLPAAIPPKWPLGGLLSPPTPRESRIAAPQARLPQALELGPEAGVHAPKGFRKFLYRSLRYDSYLQGLVLKKIWTWIWTFLG